MEDTPIQSDTLFPHETGHHRPSRERQRKGPMWGCLRFMSGCFLALLALVIIAILVVPWLLTSAMTENYIARRIELTLEARLGRDVTIGGVRIVRTRTLEPTKVILLDVRIANAPGGIHPYFARVERLEILGGIGSLRTRTLDVSRIDVINPRLNFEVYPRGAPLQHNFPQWQRTPKRPYEIYRLEFDRMYIRGGHFVFLDRRNDIVGEATSVNSDLTITSAENLYAGIVDSPRFVFRLQDYEPVEMTMRGGFRYTPGVLELESIALRGRGIEAFVSGRLDPLTEAAYNLRVRSSIDLERVREVFRVQQTLEGTIALDTSLRGKASEFRMTGGWVSPSIVADEYQIADAKGSLDITGQRAHVTVSSATYGGGAISADYRLAQYGEPYPMTVELRYDGISIEQLFADWGVENTGLRGAATGSLTYSWNKDALLAGSGTGDAKLSPSTIAFSRARYPIPISGSTGFTLDNGIITFRDADLRTASSRVALTGSLRIENLITDLRVRIDSDDFSELDRIGYNFAHAADKTDYDLLGLGGAGTIVGTVRGPIQEPEVAATIAGRNVQYNNILLGAADIALRYDGPRSTLHFDRAIFNDGVGRLGLNGTISFPDRGPSPRFDLAVEADNYPVDRAVDAVELEFEVGSGRGTGAMAITGTPDSGTVRFANMIIRRDDSELRLNGTVAWLPGDGNVEFNLDIAARSYPVADLLAFLDLSTLPVSGQLTGTLHIEGPKDQLEGAGSITIREGSIYGEPVDMATAEIVFDRGRMRATNITVQAPAGEITGEAEYDFASETFSYTITSSSIDVARLQILAGLRELFGGRLAITSSGAGTLDNPELVVEARLIDGSIQGLDLPAGTPPPSFYVAIRGGRLVIRGSLGDIVTIEGDGAVGENLAVDGAVRVVISDLARLLALSPQTAGLPVTGNAVIDLALGGRLASLEELIVDATIPTLDVRISEQQFVPQAPIRISLRDGRVNFDQFDLLYSGSVFAVTGFVEVTGDRALNLNARGNIDAALLQLFMPDMRAEGLVSLEAGVRGTMAAPLLTGTVELQDAQVKFAGFPQLIDEMYGTLRFSENRVDIESVRATIGGGTVVAGGFVTLAGMAVDRVQITLQGTEVALRYYEGLSIEGNFLLQVTGDVERMLAQGEVNVTRAIYSRDFDLQQSILNLVLSQRGIRPVVPASWQDNVLLRIDINAPDALAVRNNIADVTGSADLDVTGTLANPVILGTVDLDEGGTVTFQGIDYRVVRGTINFQNPFRIDPYFDVTLEGRVSGTISDLESGPIDLTVNITGTLDRITPSITSDPPTSDITLFSLLGLGGLVDTPGENTAGAGLVGQSLLYQSLFSALGQRILPFADSFTYDPGLLDTGSGAGPKVTFEKRVSDEVRLLVVYNLDSHQSREVIEWQVTRDWTLQITRDESEREWRTEGRFRRRYRGHWTWGGRGRADEVFPLETAEGAIAGEVSIAPLPPPTRVVTLDPGTVVQQVNIRADGAFDTSAIEQHISIEPGETLTRTEMQSSIKALYATGHFRDIRVEAEPVEGGTALTFALSINYRIGKIDVAGVEGGNEGRAERRIDLRVGEVLSLNEVDDTAGAIQEELRDYGYLEVTVDPETVFIREQNRAEVTFHVNLGPEAKVASVDISGDLAPFTEGQLLSEIREQPGRTFRVPDAEGDVQRLREFLFGRDYHRADVELVDSTYDEESNTVALEYRVDVGPVVKVEVEGVPRNAVRRLLPFRSDEDEYSEDAIAQAADDIVESYQQRGYFHATVDTESRRDDGVWTVTFHVAPGQRFRLTDVTVSGNANIEDDELEDIVATAPSGGLRRLLATIFRRPTGITREELSEDRDALESHYRLQGFSQATVETPVVTTRADGSMEIEFPVVEGPRTLVSEVTIEGLEQVAREDLPQLQLQVGEPLNPQLLREDMIALQTFYANRGNAEVQVTPNVDVSEDLTSAHVTFAISEGPQIAMDDVIVRGNTYTDTEVVLRTADLETGNPFTFSSILEAQRNLYRLGVFQRVDVQPQVAGTSPAERDVVISVEEGRNLTVSGSVGARYDRADTSTEEEDESSLAPRLAAAVAHRNLFGTGRFIGLEAVWSEDEQEAFLTYREPFVGRYDVPVQISIFQTDDGTVRDRRVRQRGTSIEASKVAGLRTRWSLQYQYKISECVSGELCERADEIGAVIPGLDRALLDIQISSITPTFFWDRRDDIIDPHRGFFTSASVEYAFPLFSAEAHFAKLFTQGAWYLPISARNVVALSARIGYIRPLRGDDPATPVDESRFVPVAERFTAGGDTSHRAYPLDLLGTLCDPPFDFEPGCTPTLYDLDRGPGYELAPLGGNSMFIVNAEYRFPIYSALGGAVFTDIGNVFATPSIDFDDLRIGLGVGFRYLSPVGPLRIDIGWPLDRPEYYEQSFNYSITLGYAF